MRKPWTYSGGGKWLLNTPHICDALRCVVGSIESQRGSPYHSRRHLTTCCMCTTPSGSELDASARCNTPSAQGYKKYKNFIFLISLINNKQQKGFLFGWMPCNEQPQQKSLDNIYCTKFVLTRHLSGSPFTACCKQSEHPPGGCLAMACGHRSRLWRKVLNTMSLVGWQSEQKVQMSKSLYSERASLRNLVEALIHKSWKTQIANTQPLAASHADRVNGDEEHERTKWANPLFSNPPSGMWT